MAKKVTTIPATLNRFDSRPIAAAKKRKTAGYARVSTDCPHTRFAGQKNNLYNGKRKGRNQWEQKNENTQRRHAMTKHSKPERCGW